MIDPATSLAFSVYENKGVYALLLGSGVSRAAHIPTGWEITLDLVRRVARIQGVEEQADWAKWHFEEYGTHPNYSELLDSLSQTPHERRALLHRYIEPSQEDRDKGWKLPTKAHRAIARLVRDGFIRVIITTNFDRLIESALGEVGIEPTVIASDDALEGAVPLIHSACTIIKVHGDYLDTRIRNTEAELSHYSSVLDALLGRVFDEHGLIACGWSADWDEALRNCILRTPNRRYPLYWASRGSRGEFADVIIKQRAGRALGIDDADSFFEGLSQKVLDLGEMHRPDARSLQLSIASAKRFLTKPEYRIQFDELLGDELRRLVSVTSNIEPTAATVPEFLRIVLYYETASEPLARIQGICGRWGSETDVNASLDIIKSLAVQEIRGGFTAFLALRNYPAMLSAYALGIGVLKAGRYDLIYKLFSLVISVGNDTSIPLVRKLFLDSWEAAEENAWNGLAEFGGVKRKTPLSDHLHTVFRQWTEDYLFDKNQFAVLFEEFELLGTLAFYSLTATKPELLTMVDDNTAQKWIWAPVGRVNNSIRKSILDRWNLPETQKTILAAGFAKADPAFLSLAVKCSGKLIDHRRLY